MAAASKFRQIISLGFFSILMIWPLIHIVVVSQTSLSSWRLFGWGMYATPTPDDQSRLRVIIKKKETYTDISSLYASLMATSNDPSEESHCVNVFIYRSPDDLERLPRPGLCNNRKAILDLEYFMHLGSHKYLAHFLKKVLASLNQPNGEIYAFLTHQRFNIFQNQAYVKSDIYRIIDDEATFLGTIDANGSMHEKKNL